MARRRRRRGNPIHVVVVTVRQVIDAFRHAVTGGASTRRRAVRRAEAPPAKCPRCHQPVKHSPHWQDHLHNE